MSEMYEWNVCEVKYDTEQEVVRRFALVSFYDVFK